MSDLVDRLRVKGQTDGERMNDTWRRLHLERIEAAREIERLRAQLWSIGHAAGLETKEQVMAAARDALPESR